MSGLDVDNLSKKRSFLMGIATVMVMIHHITWKSTNGLYYAYKKCDNLMDFYRKRFLRIVPTWLVIAISWFCYSDIINSND